MKDDRSISLNAAIEALKRAEALVRAFGYHAAIDAVQALPSAQRWIPCSERCPEHRVYVLVTYKPVYGIPDIGIAWYSKSEGKWNTSREVFAWMSLPKPYREGGQE